MSEKEIIIKENDIIRFKLRQGLSSELNGATIGEGELVYTTDENRVYVGTKDGTTTVGGKFIENFSGTPQAGDFWFETRPQEIKGGNDVTGFLKIQGTGKQITVKPVLGSGLYYDTNGAIAIDNVDESIKKYFESGTKILTAFNTKTLQVNEIKFLPDENNYTSTELQLPDRMKFGEVTIKINKPETQPATKQFALALNRVGNASNVMEAFFVPFPTGGGGGGTSLIFNTENFQVQSSFVDLSKNLKRIDSLTNSKGTKLDLGSVTKTGTVDGRLCVQKQGTEYRVFISEGTEPSSDSKPYTMLKNAIPLAWTNNGRTAPTNQVDVRFQVVVDNSLATNGMPYCIKHNVTSYQAGDLPNGQPTMGDNYFNDVTESQANIWNNSLAVIGCNNYGNLLSEHSEGRDENSTFMRSISPHYSPEFLMTKDTGDEVVPTTAGQLLMAWYKVTVNEDGETKVKYFIDGNLANAGGNERYDVEISSIACNDTEVIDGSDTKTVSSYTFKNGQTRYFVYDKTGKAMSFVYTVKETGEKITVNPFENATLEKTVTRQSDEHFYFINDEGKLEELVADEVIAKNFMRDTLIVRSGDKNPTEKDEAKTIYIQELNTTDKPETFDIISKNEYDSVNAHALVPKSFDNNYFSAEYEGLEGTSKTLYFAAITTEETGPAIFGDKIIPEEGAEADKYTTDRFFAASVDDSQKDSNEEMFDLFRTESTENSYTRAKKDNDGKILDVANLSSNAKVKLVKLGTNGRVGFETTDDSGKALFYNSNKVQKYIGIKKSTIETEEYKGNILLYFKRNSTIKENNFTRRGYNYSLDECQVNKPTSGQYDAIWCYSKPVETQDEKGYESNVLISSTNTDNNYFWFSIEKQTWINTYDIQAKYRMYGTSQLKPITELGTEFPQTTNQLSLVMEVPPSEKLYLKKSTEAVIGDEKVKLKTKDGHVQGYSDIHETLYEYKITNTGETKIIAPTILQNVYYNASGGLSQVDEQTPSGFETLQGASSVLLEVSNFTGSTIGLFTASTLSGLKQTDNGETFTAGNIEINETGYQRSSDIIKPSIPSFAPKGTEMLSPAISEKLLMVGYNGTTTVVETPVVNGSIFLRATNIKGSESNPFFIRIIGYR